jgi:magnesium transporter
VIRAFVLEGVQLKAVGAEVLTQASWIDLDMPTLDEEKLVESVLGLDVPTREEMNEIEVSNRLYVEHGAIFLTASMLVGLTADKPVLMPITYVLSPQRLVTVRYSDPRPISQFIDRACKPGHVFAGVVSILVELLEAKVNRLADVLEAAGAKLDGVAERTFEENPFRKRGASRDLRAVLKEMGRTGDLPSKTRESLIGFERVSTFLQATLTPEFKATSDDRARLKSVQRDIQALTDQVSFLTGRINLLLDATMGLISIDQNNIMKSVSVATVLFLPPPIIAGIYGMNFHYLPELDWQLGYPWALLLIVISAVLPYLFFKRKGWL